MQDLELNERNAKQAILLIWIVLVLKIVSLASGYAHYNLLQTIASGTEVSEERIDESDSRESIIAWISVIVFIVSVITFIRWFKRAYSNLHKKVNNLSYTAGWAVGSWFVPIINLYRPYKIMKELYLETKKIVNKENLSTHLLVPWWVLWLTYCSMSKVIARSLLSAKTLEGIIYATGLDMIGNIIGIILALITIKVIEDYSKAESLLNMNNEE
ncbi:MAG: DUF4328 domain-containing protein [Fibromonadaceae bacterium]|jgi:hypothetical protein|nr:DUF4328 domain-containing protein [Fibromonadaceae bacterium]